MRLFSELRRRNVLRMSVLYVITAWLIMQVTEVLMGLAALPEWIGPAVLAMLAIGFPIALIFAWIYEITPEGLKLEKDVDRSASITHATGRRMDFIAIAILTGAVILFSIDKWWVGGPPEKSIAVLAFENMSGDQEQEYFSDGISEEILNLLAKMPELTVISRSSSFSFKGKDVSLPEVAEQLNVAHILEGSVRRVGDRVRITAQLIDANSDSHLWSQSYDRAIDDIFAVQDEIAAAISDALKLKLAADGGESPFRPVPQVANSEAYDAYLKGRELTHHRTKDALQEAIGYLERSVSLDTHYAPAHAQLAIASLLYHGYGHEEGRRIAALHLDRAQALEPDLAEAYAGRALMAMNDDPESTITLACKALAVNPNYVDAMTWLRIALSSLGREQEAYKVLEQMLVTDPLSIIARTHHAGWLTDRGRVEEAHKIADRITVQSPPAGYRLHARISFWGEGDLSAALSWGLRASLNDHHASNAFLCVREFDEARRIAAPYELWIDVAEGRFDEAVQAARRQVQSNPNGAYYLADAAEALTRAGRVDEALELYERAFDLSPEGRSMIAWGPYYAVQLALARRKSGDEESAQAAALMARQGNDASRKAGEENQVTDMVEAMISAFDHDSNGAIDALRAAIRHGLRWWPIFDDPVFEDLQDEPGFVALRQELDAILTEEHEKILQLICFNNPVPEGWQPMPVTCRGAIEQRGL
jgi:TolB-like protein/Flp pilus assembly protein TadD